MGTLSVDKILKTSQGAAEFTLPATDGTVGQVMQTDGSGQLSLADVGFGGNDVITANAVGTTQIAAGAVTSNEMAADAVGITTLSATGTASATTFLRGDNAWASSIMADGTVLQVVSASYPTKVTFTASGGIYGGWQASITPASTSNKILVMGTFETSSSGTGRVQVNIKWGTTGGDTSGSQITQFTQGAYSHAASTTSLYNLSFNALVSTNSTSLLYFKPIVYKHDGGTGYLNFYGSHSTVTLLEIKA